jgi:hypothetical protein
MSENVNPFKITGSQTEVEGASGVVTPPLPSTNQTPQAPGELNVQHIDTRRLTGPLVVFLDQEI